MTDGFIMLSWLNDGYTMGTSVDELDNDTEPPSYLSETNSWTIRMLVRGLTLSYFSLHGLFLTIHNLHDGMLLF